MLPGWRASPLGPKRRLSLPARRGMARPGLEVLEDRCVPVGFLVNSLLDGPPVLDSDLTLREAITAANTNTPSGDAPAGDPGLDTITFAPGLIGGVIQLDPNEGSLTITEALTITGPGSSANDLTVDATGILDRVFNIGGAADPVTMEGITITGGEAAETNGGGIFNSGTLTLINTLVTGNRAGGSIASGGGILNSGTLALLNSTVSGNDADTDGGGLFNNGTLTLTNSTVSGNTAVRDGGGLVNRNALTLTNSTVADNEAGGTGGGLLSGMGTFAVLGNTLLATNRATASPDFDGTTLSQGNNLIGDGTGGSGFVASDQVGSAVNPINPLIAPLAANGGPTRTHALLPGSPALDAGNNGRAVDPVSGQSLTTDQRGLARIRDGVGDGNAIVDIGAYEARNPPLGPLTVPSPSNEGSAATLSLTVTHPAPGSNVTLTVNWGDGTTDTFAITQRTTAFSATHTYQNNPLGVPRGGTFAITLTLTDNLGGRATAATRIIVNNVAPTGQLGNSGPANEGGSATVAFANPSDPSPVDTASGFRFAFDFDNDGTFDLGDGTFAGSVPSPTAEVPPGLFPDGPATRTIRGRILDVDGGFTDLTTTLVINDVPPVLSLSPAPGQQVTGPDTFDPVETFTVTLSATDVGLDTITSWFIDWGDGSDPDNDGTVGEILPGNPASGTHLYGIGFATYTIRATATDEDTTTAAPPLTVSAVLTPNQLYVFALYNDLLERRPDRMGLRAWDGLLDAGTPRGQVAAGILASDEFIDLQVAELYATLLRRELDPVGRVFWRGVVRSTGGFENVVIGILTSAEYGTSRTDAQFLADVYNLILRRGPDSSGLAAWGQVLANGTLSREQVVRFFLGVPEAFGATINFQYVRFLDRLPDPVGAALFFSLASTGQLTPLQLAQVLTRSDEYFLLAQADRPVPPPF